MTAEVTHFKKSLIQLLNTFDAVTAATTCIRTDHVDQSDELPYVIIEVPDAEVFGDLSGEGGLVSAEVVIRCRSASVIEADAIGEAVRTNGTDPGTGLAGYDGPAGSGSVQGSQHTGFGTDYVPDDDGEPTGEFEHYATYRIWYSQTV